MNQNEKEPESPVLKMLNDELAQRTDWDECPALHFLYKEGRKIRVGGELLPGDVWHDHRPPDVLSWIAEQLEGTRMAQLMAAVAPKSFYGLLFRCESWMASAGPDASGADHDELMDDARRHTIHNRPDRIEARFAIAATADGIWAVHVPRSDGHESLVMSPGEEFEGAVPDALASIFRSLKGREAESSNGHASAGR